MQCFLMLWSVRVDGRLRRGSMQEMAGFFRVNTCTISRLWREINGKLTLHLTNHAGMDPEILTNDFLHDKSHFEKTKRSRPLKWDRAELRPSILRSPYSVRKDWRCLANHLGIPKSTLHDMYTKEGLFKRPKNNLKPALTDFNQAVRLAFCLDELRRRPSGGYQYNDMFDRVHVDEKWFNITKDGEEYILLNGCEMDDLEEEGPTRKVRHKQHISKVSRLKWVLYMHTHHTMLSQFV